MCRDTVCYEVDVKMISLMLSDTVLNVVLMTSGRPRPYHNTLSLKQSYLLIHSYFSKNKDPAAELNKIK